MPRQNDGTELYRQLTSIDLYRLATGSPGDTTTTAALAAAASTIAVTAITGFTAADPVFLIGDGGMELNAIGTPATTMPLARPSLLAQAPGARLVEAVKVSLGKPDKSGLSISPARSLTGIESAIDDLPVAYIESTLEMSASFALLGLNGENLQLMTGFAETASPGAGTSADPYQYAFGAANQARSGLIVVRAKGLRFDGKTFEYDFMNCRIETSGQIAHAKQQEAALPITLKFTQMAFRLYA